VLHQQLGDDWKDVLKAPFPKAVNKALDKKFAKNKNPGTYIQLRCVRNESLPAWNDWNRHIMVDRRPNEGPAPGPLISDQKGHRNRVGKCKKLLELFQQSRRLNDHIIKEYHAQIGLKAKNGQTAGVINRFAGEDYKCGDMDQWERHFQDATMLPLNKWKPLIESMKAWISAFAGTKFWGDVEVCIDLMLFWTNELYLSNPQPNFGKVLIDFWKTLCEAMYDSCCELGEIEGKFLLPIVCAISLETKQTAELGSELCELIEQIYPPAICYRVYMATIDKNKSNMVKLNCMKRLAKSLFDYGIVKCDLKKFKLKSKPFASPKDFCLQFIKLYLQLKDKKTKEAAIPIMTLVAEVLGKEEFWAAFWRICTDTGPEMIDVMKAVDEAASFRKGTYRKPEKEHIKDIIKRKRDGTRRMSPDSRRLVIGPVRGSKALSSEKEREYESRIDALQNALRQSQLNVQRMRREIAMKRGGNMVMVLSNYRQWNGDEVANWLCSLGGNNKFLKYKKQLQKVFKAEGVRGSSLDEIGRTDLRDWGVRSFDDRVVMSKEIKRLVAMFGDLHE